MSTITFPEKGRRPGAIMEELEQLRKGDIRWKAGKTWSLVYYLDDEHDRLLQEAYDAYFSENYLNSFAFPSLQQMEREVVRMAADMLNGPQAVGAMTSGGTESILLAVYTCREWSKQRHRNGRKEILAPATVHPAFEKAAHLFGLDLVRAPVLPGGEADVEAMARLIGPETLMLVASAPCYPYGIVDPVEKIGALASQHGLPLHVDACVGGFVLPWAERLGYWDAPWDFRAPGVSSVSLDVHKFGFGAKGASLVMYRDMELMKHQFFVSTEFCGGIYVSPTLLGTRPGGGDCRCLGLDPASGGGGLCGYYAAADGGRRPLESFFPRHARTGAGRRTPVKPDGVPHYEQQARHLRDRRFSGRTGMDGRPAAAPCLYTPHRYAE